MDMLATLGVVAVLGFLLMVLAHPIVSPALVKGQLIACLNNAHQIQLASSALATDGEANKDPSLDWPGDLKASGRIANVADYVNLLVRNDYLKPGDLRVFSAAGCARYPDTGTLTSGSNGVLVPPFTEENNAFKVYLVKKDDPADTIFW